MKVAERLPAGRQPKLADDLVRSGDAEERRRIAEGFDVGGDFIELGGKQIDLLNLVADHLDILGEFNGVLDSALRDGNGIVDDELGVCGKRQHGGYAQNETYRFHSNLLVD